MHRRLISTAVCLCWVVQFAGCNGQQIRDKEVTHQTLSTGEVISCETWVVGDDPAYSTLHTQFYYQTSGAAPMEKMGQNLQGNIPDLGTPAQLVLHQSDSVIVLIGRHLFRRSILEGKPWWYQRTTEPEDAGMYLRSFIPSHDKRIPQRGQFEVDNDMFQTPIIGSLDYGFDHFDQTQDLLVTKRLSPDEVFPKFLVYSRALYGDGWKFDLERTRAANSLPPPTDPRLEVEISIVTYPGAFASIRTNDSRDAAITLAGAKEVFHQTLPLSATTWPAFDYPLALPTGAIVQQRFEMLFGFQDPEAGYFSVVWKGKPLSGSPQPYTLKCNVWKNIFAGGFLGSLNQDVYFRVVNAK